MDIMTGVEYIILPEYSPLVSSYTWIEAVSASSRIISPTSFWWPTRTNSYIAAPDIPSAMTTMRIKIYDINELFLNKHTNKQVQQTWNNKIKESKHNNFIYVIDNIYLFAYMVQTLDEWIRYHFLFPLYMWPCFYWISKDVVSSAGWRWFP